MDPYYIQPGTPVYFEIRTLHGIARRTLHGFVQSDTGAYVTVLAPSFKSFLPQSLTLFPKMMLAVRCFSIPFLMVTQIIYPLNAVIFVAASCKLLVNLAILTFTS